MPGVRRSYGSGFAEPEPLPEPDPEPKPITNFDTDLEHGLASTISAINNESVIRIRKISGIENLRPRPRGSFGTSVSSLLPVSEPTQES